MSGDDQANDRERRQSAARMWLKIARAVESGWALLDERKIGAAAFRDLGEDSVALLSFQASAAHTILALRAMARVLDPACEDDTPPAVVEPSPPAEPGPAPLTVREVRLALLAVAGHVNGEIMEGEINRWSAAKRREAVAWAFEQGRQDAAGKPIVVEKPHFIP